MKPGNTSRTLTGRKVSVIIPCRNEESYIAKCISSVINNGYQPDLLEVLVCDGNSTDNSVEIIKSLSSEYSNVKLLINSEGTTPHALNLGIKHSDGEIILILGAHAELLPGYIEGCVKLLSAANGVDCAGGIIKMSDDGNLSGIIGKASSSRFGVGSAYFRTGQKEGFVDTVAFGAYRRDIFDKIGMFDENLIRNQDDEFNFRLLKNGYKIYLSLDISILYHNRSNLRNLFRQYFQYGYWKVYVNRKHRTITTLRQIVPALFVIFLMSLVLSPLLPAYFWIWSSGIVVYLAMGILSAFSRVSWKSIFTFQLACFYMHFSYGYGYILGIKDFVLLNRGMTGKNTGLTR